MKNKKQIYIVIFISFALTRFLYFILSGFDNFQLQTDSYWYSNFSDEILKGNFNLVNPQHIVAPLFPYFQAFIKFITGSYWMISLNLIQIVLASISGIYFYKITDILFNKKFISLISTLLFCFYPSTIYWTSTFAQEIWFQSFLIFFIYNFLFFLKNPSNKTLSISAIVFSITFLIKSHILLFSIFIPLIILVSKIRFIKKVMFIIIFIFISLISTLPYGLFNLKNNDIYVLSSTGFASLFLLGHNDTSYNGIVNIKSISNLERKKFITLDHDIYYKIKDKTDKASQRELQKIYIAEGIMWIKENKKKAIILALTNLKKLFTPGIDKNWHSYNKYLFSFIVSLPIFIIAFPMIFLSCIKNFSDHSWVLFLIFSMMLIAVLLQYVGRFRVITLEPFLLIYFTAGIDKILDKLFKNK
jgi:hypothetical protein